MNQTLNTGMRRGGVLAICLLFIKKKIMNWALILCQTLGEVLNRGWRKAAEYGGGVFILNYLRKEEGGNNLG